MPNNEILRYLLGFLYIISLFSPLAVYHSLEEPYLQGILWAFMTPLGYISLVIGILIIFYNKLKFVNRLHHSSLIFYSGIIIILTWLLQPTKTILKMYYSTTTEFDLDYYSPLTTLPIIIAVISILYKLVYILRNKRI